MLHKMHSSTVIIALLTITAIWFPNSSGAMTKYPQIQISETINLGNEYGIAAYACIPATGAELPADTACYTFAFSGLPYGSFSFVKAYDVVYMNTDYLITATFTGTYVQGSPPPIGTNDTRGVTIEPPVPCSESDECGNLVNSGAPTAQMTFLLDSPKQTYEDIQNPTLINWSDGDFVLASAYNPANGTWAIYVFIGNGTWAIVDSEATGLSGLENTLHDSHALYNLINTAFHQAEAYGAMPIPPGTASSDTGYSYYVDLIEDIGVGAGCVKSIALGTIVVNGNCSSY